MKKKKLTLIALACVICLVAVPLSPPAYASRTAEEVQAEIDEKMAFLDELEERIVSSQSDKEKAEAAVQEYQQNYETLVGLIDEQELFLQDTEGQLDRKTKELSGTIAALQENRELFEKRLVAIYKMNNQSVLAQVLSVESFTDFFQMLDALQRISQNDTAVLEDLANKKEAFERQKLEIEGSISRLTEELATLQQNRDWAAAKVAEMQFLAAQAAAAIQESEQETEETEESVEELQAELDRIFAEAAARGSNDNDGSVRYDGPLSWPVPASSSISSYYGDPRSNTGWHYGIDIPAGEGTDIVAAASGTVITAEWHYSYGNYLIVDHGGGLRTLYAHCSALYVGVGTQVATKQTIAAVGNTGNSFGAHLHFEVHDGGGRVNPLDSGYLSV